MSIILKIQEVTKRTALSKSSIYSMVQKGKFPAPIKLSARSSGWLESEVNGWLAARIAERDTRAA